jgi:hypothetical protein
MEMQQHEEVKTTTNYWGYRELSANEIQEVGGGGDFSGDGFGGNTGYGASSYTSYASTQGSNSALGICPAIAYPPAQPCVDGIKFAGAAGAAAGGLFGGLVGFAFAGVGTVPGSYFGTTLGALAGGSWGAGNCVKPTGY